MGLARALGDTPGYAFGRYETLFRIGSGGMAEVFAARLCGEAGFERLVAIKRLLPHLAEDPQYVARFLDEARLTARVVHPNVVQTLDLGRTDEGEPFLVLELIVGSSLEPLIRSDTRPPVPVLASWLAQSAEGLHAAHVARAPDGTPLGMVHRDVSPHNILVGLDGDARISDFGIAQAALLKSAHTPTGQVTGKFAYFSPEQAQGLRLDARADVFALGIVAWEALTGMRLFAADSPARIFDNVRSLEIVPPHRLFSDIPAKVSAVVMEALERDVAVRTPTAQAFARALREAAKELPEPASGERARWVRTVQDPMWQRLGGHTQSSTRAVPTALLSKPRRRGIAFKGLASVAVVALGGALALLPNRDNNRDGAAEARPPASVAAPATATPEASLPSRSAASLTTGAQPASASSGRPESPGREGAPPELPRESPQPAAQHSRARVARAGSRTAPARAARREQARDEHVVSPARPPAALLGSEAFERDLQLRRQQPAPRAGLVDWGSRP